MRGFISLVVVALSVAMLPGVTAANARANPTAAGAVEKGAVGEANAPVLLTFNLETDADAASWAAVAQRLPPGARFTAFMTGRFAERHPRLARRIAENATIGSMSYAHPDLTDLAPAELHRELQLGRLVLEEAVGRKVRWFRAPFLRYDDAVVRELSALGFTHDSSDLERWPRQLRLASLPISTEDGGERPASDFDLLQAAAMAPEAAADWLLARLDERRALGRPLVIVLRPRLVAENPVLLDRFLAGATSAGARFLAADDYTAEVFAERPKRWAAWIDLSQGGHDPELVRADVLAAGLTDVFVQADDPDGVRYWSDADAAKDGEDRFGAIVAALADTSVRVHAWISVLRDPLRARRNPARAMVDRDGRVSDAWLSPGSSEIREETLATVTGLLDRYPLDGIHLDYLRYPSLDFDFAPAVVAAFRESTDAETSDLRLMFDRHYNEWTDTRARTVADLARAVAEVVGDRAELSAALYADAATQYRTMETMGQDFTLLAEHLDFLVPMAYVEEQRRWPGWISNVALAARYRAGSTPVWAGIEAFQRPPDVVHDLDSFRAGLAAASRGYGGVSLYAYSFLFGRGPEVQNLPPDATRVLAEQRESKPVPRVAEPVVPGPASEPVRRSPYVYFAIIVVFAVAAAAAARGRARRMSRRGARDS